MTRKVIISPDGKSLSIAQMEDIFDKAGAVNETIFRRLEFNQVIQFTRGIGVDIGCGLSKIHSAAIGVDFQLGEKDFGYPFGANIRVARNKDWLPLPWFKDETLDFVFSSHCLEHFSEPVATMREILRLLKPGGYLVLILPDMRYYPRKGEHGANPDHEWDCYPQVVVDIANSVAPLETVQLDTLQERLQNVRLTPRDKRIAAGYGHKSLNFSFEGVFRKL